MRPSAQRSARDALTKCRQDVLCERLDCVEAFIAALHGRLEDQVMDADALRFSNVRHHLRHRTAEQQAFRLLANAADWSHGVAIFPAIRSPLTSVRMRPVRSTTSSDSGSRPVA